MKHTAEIFDQLQLLFETTGFSDHQLHCVLRFAAPLDAAVLRNAVIASLDAAPILGSRYVDDRRKPRWEGLDTSRFPEAFVPARTEREFDEQVTSRIDEARGPQVSACLLETGLALSVTMNHMVCDAAGLKLYLYLLCDIYTRLASGTDSHPVMMAGDRGIREVLARFTLGARLRSLVSQSAENNDCGDHRFPLGDAGDVRPFILTRKLGKDSTASLKAWCKARGATLNDAALAAYYRGLFRALSVSPGTELRMPLMVDMRRYLRAPAGSDTLSNLSSTVMTRLAYRPGEAFADTLERVKAEMDRKKNGNIGLNGFVKLSLLFRLLPNAIARRRLRSGLKNPLICMTNVGILDSARLSFGGIRPQDAFMCGSIKHKPHFQLAMSSYEGELTFSSNLYGSAEDRERVSTFMAEVVADLPR